MAATVAVAVPGCSSGSKTYSDPVYGFSFQYPSHWQILELGPEDLPEGLSGSVGAWDPRGPGSEEELAFDFVSVDVFELGTDSGVSADTLRQEFERWLASAGTSDSSFTVAEDPSPVKIGGLDGYRATYTYSDDETQVRCAEYWLLAGTVMYDLYTSASADHWQDNETTFDAFLDSFTVEPRD